METNGKAKFADKIEAAFQLDPKLRPNSCRIRLDRSDAIGHSILGGSVGSPVNAEQVAGSSRALLDAINRNADTPEVNLMNQSVEQNAELATNFSTQDSAGVEAPINIPTSKSPTRSSSRAQSEAGENKPETETVTYHTPTPSGGGLLRMSATRLNPFTPRSSYNSEIGDYTSDSDFQPTPHGLTSSQPRQEPILISAMADRQRDTGTAQTRKKEQAKTANAKNNDQGKSWKKTVFIVLSFCAVGLAWTLARHGTHEMLISIGERFPIVNTIGNYFHEKSGTTEKEGVTNDWKWEDGPRPGTRFFSDIEIAYKEGEKSYLVILGNVFDVSSNKESYKAGSGYHGFIGQDASRAFVSGNFTPEGLINDLDGLSSDDYLGLVTWIAFYYKNYPHVGYHIGRFYTSNGEETPYFKKVRQWVTEAERAQEADLDIKKQFPPCNMEWSAKTEMTEYWCSKKSGGIDRDWEGYPYQFQEQEGKPFRCACIHSNHLMDSRVKAYDNCPARSTRCRMSSPKNK